MAAFWRECCIVSTTSPEAERPDVRIARSAGPKWRAAPSPMGESCWVEASSDESVASGGPKAGAGLASSPTSRLFSCCSRRGVCPDRQLRVGPPALHHGAVARPNQGDDAGLGALPLASVMHFQARLGIWTTQERFVPLFLFITAPISANMIARCIFAASPPVRSASPIAPALLLDRTNTATERRSRPFTAAPRLLPRAPDSGKP